MQAENINKLIPKNTQVGTIDRQEGHDSIVSIQDQVRATVDRLRVARELAPADLLLKNCEVFNVNSGEIIKSDIAISGERVAAVRPNIGSGGVKRVIDCTGKYAVPGYLEPHMHIETTLISPRQLSRVLTPFGTTSIFADGTDVSYIAGISSVRTLIDATKNIPLRVFLEAPSYSAYLQGIQTTGGQLGLKEALEMLEWEETVSLGEIVAAKVLVEEEEYLQKIVAYKFAGKRLNGHTALESEKDLDGFVTVGITDDHTVNDPSQILPRLRRGLTLFLVEAPGRRRLAEYVDYIVAKKIPTDRICFCIDNTTVIDMVEGGYGYIDYLIRLGVEHGLDPIQAVQMASINTARYFKLDGEIGNIAPGRFADILLLDNLTNFRPQQVIFGGKIVAENGCLIEELDEHQYPDAFLNSIQLHSNVTPEQLDLRVNGDGNRAKVRVLELPAHDEQAGNIETVAILPVYDNVINSSIEQDVIYLCVVERYGKNGNIGHGFCKGSNLREGAIATSLSISDSNIVVLGCDRSSMWTAIMEVASIQGGIAVAKGDQVLTSYPLPLGGQMSDAPYEQLIEAMKEIKATTDSLGSRLKNPALTLASTVLMSIPDLGLTDAGYVDARTGNLMPTVIETF